MCTFTRAFILGWRWRDIYNFKSKLYSVLWVVSAVEKQRREEGWEWCEAAILKEISRPGVAEMVTFEQKNDGRGGKRISCMSLWGRFFRGNNCKLLRWENSEYLMKSKEVCPYR